MFGIKPVWQNLLKNQPTLSTVLNSMRMLFLISTSQPIRLVGVRRCHGDNLSFQSWTWEGIAGRDLKDKEFTFKLVDVIDGANPVGLRGNTNDAKGKIVFQISPKQARRLSLSKLGNDEDVVYDKPEANITIQVVRETVDNQVKWLPRSPIQKTLSLTQISNTSQGRIW